MERIAVYPGSFDPVTNGHYDIIKRAAKQFDILVVGVLDNSGKTPLFSIEERVNILKEVVKDLENVRVESFSGLSVDFVKRSGAQTIIRGLRAVTDFEYELQMAQTNRVLYRNADTMCFITNLKYAYISSSIVKEVAQYGGDISPFVSPYVEEKLKEKFRGINKSNI